MRKVAKLSTVYKRKVRKNVTSCETDNALYVLHSRMFLRKREGMGLRQISYCSVEILKTSLVLFFGIASVIFIGDIFEVRYLILLKASLLFNFCLLVANHVHFWPTKKISSKNKAVLITGCDTGFGNRLALRLHKKGFHVFAACLDPKSEGAVELENESCNDIQIIKLDVTSSSDVSAARAYIEESLEACELWAIVNNAGIAKGTMAEIASTEDFQQVLDVNLIGVIRVCKAFLPLLRNCHGRVVTITSMAGKLPLLSSIPYSLSKHATNAFSDMLRLEMYKWDVSVINIQPWIFRTGILKNFTKNEHFSYPDDVKHAYSSKYLLKSKKRTRNIFRWFTNPNIEEAVDAMAAAITDANPQYAYSPGKWYLTFFFVLLTFLPKPVQDYILCNLMV